MDIIVIATQSVLIHLDHINVNACLDMSEKVSLHVEVRRKTLSPAYHI